MQNVLQRYNIFNMKGLTIRKWIESLEEKGIYSFSMQELKEVFAHLKEKTILNTLGTLKKARKAPASLEWHL